MTVAPDLEADLLRIEDLTVSFGGLRAVEEASLTVRAGQICAVVGESGCGKSTLAATVLNVVPPPGRITHGRVLLRGRDLSNMHKAELNRIRGREVSMVFQAAMNAFNPVLTIGTQAEHVIEAHPGVFNDAGAGMRHFDELLDMVRLPPAQTRRAYESQLSGGMRQRAAIALSLVLKPSVLILDEPTTALDVINQRLILDILYDLHDNLDVTILFVTHDLAIVAELATHVAVMYAGRLVEAAPVDDIFAPDRRHPYVAALIAAIPSVLDEGLDVSAIPGQVPLLSDLPPGCRFAPRCPLAIEVCHSIEPPLLTDDSGHAIACHVVNERTLGRTA